MEHKFNKIINTVVCKRYFNENNIDLLNNLDDEIKIIITNRSKEKSFLRLVFRLLSYTTEIEELYNSINRWDNLTQAQRRNNSFENFIMRYGIKEGSDRFKKYEEWNSSKNSFSVDYLVKTGKYNEEEANVYISNVRKKLSKNIKLYYDNITEQQKREDKILCVEYWNKRGYNNEESKKQISNIQSNNAKLFWKKYNRTGNDLKERCPLCKEYYIKRGHTEEESIFLRNNYINENGIQNLKNRYIKKYGYDQGIIKFNDVIKRRTQSTFKTRIKNGDKSCKASKPSLKIFIPIMYYLKQNNISEKDIFIGYENKIEYFIAHSNKYYYSYDFAITSLNLIFEYNGSMWHPRKNRLSEYEYTNWKIPFKKSTITAEKKEEEDLKKIKIAESKGFDVIELWDNDEEEYNLSLCLEEINKRLKNNKFTINDLF